MVDFPKLDLENGLFIQNLDNPVEGALMEWGIPSCLLDFGKNVLSLLPSDALGGFALGVQEGKEAAQNAVADGLAWAFRDLGILEIDADTGKLKFLSTSSRYGIDANWAKYPGMFFGILDELESLYAQGTTMYNEILACIEESEAWFDLISGEETGSAPLVLSDGPLGGDPNDPTDPKNWSPFQQHRQGEFLIAKQQFQAAVNFSNRCTSSLNMVSEILAEREIEDVRTEQEEATKPIFRLVFGPPEAKKGRFLLSVDGLYYDSQIRSYADDSEVPTEADLGIVLPWNKFDLDRDPNLGGRGTAIALSDLGKYVDTFFDINKINDSQAMQVYYENDHFLQVLQQQKNKEVYDISGHINSLIVSGYDAKSALVLNYKQSIFAAIDRHTVKINKRKKQIEVAVSAMDVFGADQGFDPGNIPINDFSYLTDVNLDIDLEKQRKLVFREGEVSGVVLPIRPMFVRGARATAKTLLPPLVVPPIGAGGIITLGDVSGTDAPVLSLTDNIITDNLFAIYNFLNTDIVDLSIDSYNQDNDSSWGSQAWEDSNTRELDKYKLLNCANDSKNNAQLITDDAGDAYDKGLGIVKLKGIARHQYKDGSVYLSGLGSAVKLPDTNEFQDLLYDGKGTTIEAWVHIPNYGTLFKGAEYYGTDAVTGELISDPTIDTDSGHWADYNYYKLLLSCENTGGTLSGSPTDMQLQGDGTNTTKGFIMGFTRDPQIFSPDRITPGSDVDPASALELPVSATAVSSCFFLAPTQSVNGTDVEFASVSGPSPNQLTYAKMTVNASASVSGVTNVSGVKFNDVSGDFVHINVAFDPAADEIRIHLDGVLMATSSIATMFGIPKHQMPRIPTFISTADSDVSSFYYYDNNNGSTVDQLGTSAFNVGPNNYNDGNTGSRNTPWIVGGGWTDGMKITNSSGGFMANKHGYRSALDGYVGSLKFYSKALTNSEVVTNYNAQKAFFKNIKI